MCVCVGGGARYEVANLMEFSEETVLDRRECLLTGHSGVLILETLLFGALMGLEVAPRALDASEAALPPLVEVGVGARRRTRCLVQRGAQPTEEVRVDEAAHLLPLEVFVVERVVGVQLVQEVGHLLGRGEVVNVDERVLRRVTLVVDSRGAHHDRDHVASIIGKKRDG